MLYNQPTILNNKGRMELEGFLADPNRTLIAPPSGAVYIETFSDIIIKSESTRKLVTIQAVSTLNLKQMAWK